MHIKLLEPSDLTRAVDLFVRVFNGPPLYEKWTVEIAKQHILDTDQRLAYAALNESNQLIGIILGFYLHQENGKWIFVDTIVVDTESQNQGAGSELLKQYNKLVDQENLRGLRLVSNVRLHAFEWYKRLGFEESGWIELKKEFNRDS